MRLCLAIFVAFAATAFADDLFKPVDEEVVLLEAEPAQVQTQNQMFPFMFPFMNPMMMMNPFMMMNPMMMGSFAAPGYGSFGAPGYGSFGASPFLAPLALGSFAAATAPRPASFLEEQVEAQPAQPEKPMFDPFTMMMFAPYMMNPMMYSGLGSFGAPGLAPAAALGSFGAAAATGSFANPATGSFGSPATGSFGPGVGFPPFFFA